jgi:tetratricopeptide (TPR) repeat protein/predicted membrane-bound spermidine synthase
MQDKTAINNSQGSLTSPAPAPGTIIFVSSACVMILELAAGRIATRQYGASLYAWTSVIGVTLAGLTFGNYLGGRLADSFSARKTIGWLLASCSAACAVAIVVNNLMDKFPFLWRLGLAAQVLVHISIVFFIPSVLIGAINPAAIKAALEKSRHRGGTVGRMYALGAAGSILGTFLAGFWFIAAVGTINTIWLVAAVMLLGAIVYLPKSVPMYALASSVAFIIVAGTIPSGWAERLGSAISLRQTHSPDILYETESKYSYIAVRQLSKQPDERQFIQDNLKNQGRLIMGDIRDLRFFYTQVYAAVTHRIAKNKNKLNVLSIGGGGYVFPRYILDFWPASHVDVAEIDPAVTEAAKRAFGLAVDTPINTINLDGRNCVDELLERNRLGEQIRQYDIVYMDAFNDMSVPFQLVTRQFNEKIFAITASDGFYIVNLIDMLYSVRFLASFVGTIRQTFPYVYVVSRQYHHNLPVNFIVIAGKIPFNLENLGSEGWLAETPLWIFDDNDMAELSKKAGGIILDDDYAPLENFMAPVVLRASAYETAKKYIDQAEKLNTEGNWEQAVKKYRLGISVCSAFSLQGYYLMGQILIDHGKLADAADALRSALTQEDPESKAIAPKLHYQLGVILKKLNDTEGASKHFTGAIELLKAEMADKGDSALIYSRLGQVEASSGDMEDATKSFEQALKLDPDNISHHQAVIQALVAQGRYDEAIQQLNSSIQYMQSKGRSEVAEQLKQMLRTFESEKLKK